MPATPAGRQPSLVKLTRPISSADRKRKFLGLRWDEARIAPLWPLIAVESPTACGESMGVLRRLHSGQKCSSCHNRHYCHSGDAGISRNHVRTTPVTHVAGKQNYSPLPTWQPGLQHHNIKPLLPLLLARSIGKVARVVVITGRSAFHFWRQDARSGGLGRPVSESLVSCQTRRPGR